MLVGDSCVGKTSIFNNYFDIKSDLDIAPIGIDSNFKIFTLNDGSKLRLNLYDISGAERFRSIVLSGFKKINAIIKV